RNSLRISEGRYRRLFEAAQDGILLVNADTAQIEDVNPYLIHMLGYSHAEMLGKKLWEVGAFADRAESKDMFVQLQLTGYVRYEDLALMTRGGALVDVEFVSNSYNCDGIKVIQCNIRDITDRKAAEASSLRHAHLYAALSQANKAIVHSNGEEDLFLQVCRAAVQFGGMKMARVGLIDAQTQALQPVASFGDDTGYLRQISVLVDPGSEFGRGPTGTAVREDRPYWCQDFQADPTTAPWRDHAARAGLAASASLPLHRNGIAVGAFTVYSGEINAFDEAARALLLEMAADISFALDNFDRESRRERVETQIILSNAILKTQQETSLDAILVVDENGLIISYNQQFIALWGLSPQLVGAGVDAPVLQSVTALVENTEGFVARIQYLNEHLDETSRDEIALKDGRIVDRYSAPCRGADGRYYGRVWYFRDITERKHAQQSLQASESKYKRLIENSPDVIYAFSSNRGGIYFSSRVASILGYSMEYLRAHPLLWNESIHPDDHAMVAAAIEDYKAGTPFKIEYRIRTAAGDWRWFYDRAIGGWSEGDDFIIEGLAMDITERKEAEGRVTYLTRVHAVLSGINTLIVHVSDRDELFHESCRIAVAAGGFRMAMIGVVDRATKKIVLMASEGKDDALMSKIRMTLSHDELASKTMVSRAIRSRKTIVSNDSAKDPQLVFGGIYAEAGVRSAIVLPLMMADEAIGVLALYASESSFFHDEELNLLQELAGDIAFAIDHIDKQEQLNYLAYYDALTGLANRSLFLERLAQYLRIAIRGGHRLAIGLIDLERFKSINDGLGRPAGDALLKQVAEWLTRSTGDVNLLARMDADHFAIVMPEATKESDVARFVDKTIKAFHDNSFRLNGAEFRVTPKVGIALYPEDGADAETLFRNAEAALKQAKATGNRYLFYTHKMTDTVASKLALENHLHDALDHEEFVLHYQPKMKLASGKVTSVEALLRWNDPHTGLVPPDRFIPILEEIGLINEVGRWALHKAAADYLRWLDSGLAAVRIAVNVSPLQLRDPGFINEMAQLIATDARLADGLELEITESVIMAEASIVSLQAIRSLGIRIAIDDFGTGFSSLSYLAKLPVHTLKIDRSFVIDMTVGEEGLALVTGIINLAHSLKLNVVAEGVETEEQQRLLRLLGCDEIQGFLFSKPLPSKILEKRFLSADSGR
ncbi:MAG: EAL domain-containing protein, partial [Rhodanobacteraceae bacterium]